MLLLCTVLYNAFYSYLWRHYWNGILGPSICKEGFAFNSELEFHKMVHRKVHSYHCVAKNCGKSYKSSNELNKHAQKHLGVSWECSKCDYTTDDWRNLRGHHKKHQKIGLHKCIPCDKSFNFYMQLKRH